MDTQAEQKGTYVQAYLNGVGRGTTLTHGMLPPLGFIGYNTYSV